MEPLTVSSATREARYRPHVAPSLARPDARTRSGCNRVVGAEHADTRTKLGPSERDHVLPNMGSNHLSVLRSSVIENPLDKIVAVLVAGNIDQWNTSAISTAFTDAVKVPTKEVSTTNLEALFDDLGCKLICAILGSVPNDMINCSTTVRRSAMFANMLNAPIPKLAMGDDVDIG